jgi:hypothetical protein
LRSSSFGGFTPARPNLRGPFFGVLFLFDALIVAGGADIKIRQLKPKPAVNSATGSSPRCAMAQQTAMRYADIE